MLAGVVNGPQYYSPILNKERAKQRQTLVLKAMYDNQMITQSILEATQSKLLI